jgi:(S)-citramalyl-CoA lyase
MASAIGIQSMLFVPGTKPERFAKALASGADLICIDLEDSVPAADKDAARVAALAALATDPRLAVRINGLTTRAGLADLLALAAAPTHPNFIFVPMVESPFEMRLASHILANGEIGLVPLIETVRGLAKADKIAASSSVAMLMFGGGDLSAQLGVDIGWVPLLHARSQLIFAGAGAGKPVMDMPWIDLDDQTGLQREAALAKELGFAAKAAIHPAQIAAIHTIFRPSLADVEVAEAAEAAYRASGGAAVRFNGKMLEEPMMRRYRQIIALKGKAHA